MATKDAQEHKRLINTLLFLSVERGNIQGVNELISHNADVNFQDACHRNGGNIYFVGNFVTDAQDENGDTPLMVAC